MKNWKYLDKEINSLEDFPKINGKLPHGFVYELKLYTKTGKLKYIYVGKKNLINIRNVKASKKDLKTISLRSMKRKNTRNGPVYYRRSERESDWKNYHSSNDFIKKNLSKFIIERTILRLCETDGELSYREAQEIICRDAMDDPLYLNNGVSIRRFATKVL